MGYQRLWTIIGRSLGHVLRRGISGASVDHLPAQLYRWPELGRGDIGPHGGRGRCMG